MVLVWCVGRGAVGQAVRRRARERAEGVEAGKGRGAGDGLQDRISVALIRFSHFSAGSHTPW